MQAHAAQNSKLGFPHMVGGFWYRKRQSDGSYRRTLDSRTRTWGFEPQGGGQVIFVIREDLGRFLAVYTNKGVNRLLSQSEIDALRKYAAAKEANTDAPRLQLKADGNPYTLRGAKAAAKKLGLDVVAVDGGYALQ